MATRANQRAFARPYGWNGMTHYEENEFSGEQEGLTKREYFAAAALQGWLANPCCNNMHAHDAAVFAVGIADELVAALNAEAEAEK